MFTMGAEEKSTHSSKEPAQEVQRGAGEGKIKKPKGKAFQKGGSEPGVMCKRDFQ